MRPFTLCVALVLAGLDAAGASLIGNDYKGVLYDVDRSTGILSNPRPTGLANLCGLAYAADGTLYAFANPTATGQNPIGSLYTINPVNGVATLIGAFGLADVLEGDLAFDPTTGRLYGVQDATPGSRLLFSINPATGVGADIGVVTSGPSTTSDLSAMAFDTTGKLYVVDTSVSGLLTVNKSTGSVIGSVTMNIGGAPVVGYQALGSTAGLVIDATGETAYLATGSNGVLPSTDSLYAINLATGALTLIGKLTGGTEGLAGLAIPPPSLSVTKAHAGNFTKGQTNVQYTVTATNNGGPTSGMVMVTENIPTGLTLVSMSGTGWTCASATCTRSDVVLGASYPSISVTANVAADAPSLVTNQVTVSGGGSPMASASDSTTIATATSINNVTSSVANGTYGAGSSIPIQVTFSAAVTVTGTPQLALNSGGMASYSSGSGSATLTFSYTVGASDSASHLDYTSTSALMLNGGTINASLTLPAPGAMGSLGANTNIVIGAPAPAVFFTGEVSLGSGVEFLKLPDATVFGYFTFVSSSIFYHYDMGYEAFIPGSASDIYLYDFASGHWWYTSPALFPNLYDFALQSWIYYFPDTKNPGHYTNNPRYFSNLATAKIFTM